MAEAEIDQRFQQTAKLRRFDVFALVRLSLGEGVLGLSIPWSDVLMRSVAVGLLMACVCATPAYAQSWAKGLFPVTSHDFGTVARAAKTEFRFPVQNNLGQELHIASVRASCGCTTPIVETETIKAGETGYITARFNTGSFFGQRSATLTVVIDRPRYAEVQVSVKGYVRTDVVFNPGEVNFGTIEAGEPQTKKVALEYAGRSDWQITNVRSPSEFISAEVKEANRGNGRVSYELEVSIKEGAPVGPLQNELILETNDRRLKSVALRYTADVQPVLSVSPQIVDLKDIAPGASVQQRIVVRGAKPFRITGITLEGFTIDYQASDEPKAVHLIPVTITAGDEVTGNSAALVIKTDLPGDVMTEVEATYNASSTKE